MNDASAHSHHHSGDEDFYGPRSFSSRNIPEQQQAIYEHDTQPWPCASLPWEKKPDPAKLRRAIAYGPEGVEPELGGSLEISENCLTFTRRSRRRHRFSAWMLQGFAAYLLSLGIYYVLSGPPALLIWGVTLLLLIATISSLFLPRMLTLTFERRTGLVTLDDDGGGAPEIVSLMECDPYIRRRSGKDGIVARLGIRPRRTRRLAEPWYVLDARNEEEVFVMWHFIQMYMDVSRPLPDIPALEVYRSGDQTTAEYDKKHGREEEFWAWKSPEERALLYEKAKERFPAVSVIWPCIMAERIPGRSPDCPITVRPS